MPFLALADDYREVERDVRDRIEAVLADQSFVLGRQTEELERTLVDLTTAARAVACASGSDALYLALVAAGIGPGDAVAVPAFTFFATAGAVVRAGALPVFVDVDEDTLCVGADALTTRAAGRLRRDGDGGFETTNGLPLRALIAVHLYGRACDMGAIDDSLGEIGRPPLLIEDAAQALGAHGNVAAVGAWGRAACFSFYPTKNLGGAGDGGAVTTDDGVLADRIARLRTHGAAPGSYLHEECGINARLGELQAAYLNAKASHLAAWTERRRALAARYAQRLEPLQRAGRIRLPAAAEPGSHVYHQFTLRVPVQRDRTLAAMAALGVETRVFYPLPVHLQPSFAELGYRAGDLPVSEGAAAAVLSLPIYPSLSEEKLERVCTALRRALDEAP